MYDSKATGGVFGTMLSAFGAGLSITEIQAMVSIITTMLGFIITITSTVVIPMIKKYKAAKKDGKITIDEVEDMAETLKDGLSKTKDELDKNNK